MSLEASTFADLMLASAGSCTPSNLAPLSAAMLSYLSTGTPKAGTVTIAPCAGAGWLALAAASVSSPATAAGFKTAIQTELAGTTVTIPPTTRPASWNSGAEFPDLTKEKDAKGVWTKICQYIIDYVSTELT